MIRVRDPEMIDYEKKRYFTLTVSGKGLGARDELGLNAYTTCVVSVRNVNDNPPRFGQDVYRANVMEGLDKESIVTRVVAFDLDRDRLDFQNKRDAIVNGGDFLYEIIDGNVDGAFTMKTSAPGVLFTNTVLDREIRETDELTISASDASGDISGTGQSYERLTGVTKVIVKVLDANDSPLQFPEIPPMKAHKDILPGAYIGTIRANDIDIGPSITYKLSNFDTDTFSKKHVIRATDDMISIDTFTGQLFLLNRDFIEASNPSGIDVEVNVEASDGIHTTHGKFLIQFEDSTRTCKPRFKSQLYNFHIDVNSTEYPQVLGNLDVMPCTSRPSSVENILLTIF